MGAEKGNEDSGGTEGRGGSDKPRQRLSSYRTAYRRLPLTDTVLLSFFVTPRMRAWGLWAVGCMQFKQQKVKMSTSVSS